jgi:putative alpha-1,2-mannosidase
MPTTRLHVGNEPGLMTVYEFLPAQRADLTQKFVRAIIKQSYNTQPHGIPGMA